MANYIVLAPVDVPALGQIINGLIYRGDHATEGDAINAAAGVMKPPTGTPMWVLSQGNMTKYIVTESRSFSSAVG
jgi:hypothetical protein